MSSSALARILALVSVAGGCGRDAAPDPERRATLRVLWTVGQEQEEGPELFEDVIDLLLDDLGRLHVLDAGAGRVRVFATDGSAVRSYGRPGQGPGELAGPAGLSAGPGGETWILDVASNRYSVYDSTGSHVRDLTRPADGYSRPWMGGFDGTGGLLDATFRRTDRGNELVLVRARVVRDPAGLPVAVEPRDTFPLPRAEAERFIVYEIDPQGRRRGVSVDIPFSTGLRSELTPTGTVWQAWTCAYRLVEFTPGRDTVRRVQRPVLRVRVTDAQLDSAAAELGRRTSPELEFDRGRIPRMWPALEHFFGDREGRLWVRPIEDPPLLGFYVHDRGGRPVRVDPPGRLEAEPTPEALGDTLWAVTRDELGVARVVKGVWSEI